MSEGKIVKKDGTVLRSKELIAEAYDKSWWPYPLRPLIELDYCWSITKMLARHSIFMAIPVTLTYTVATAANKEFLSTVKMSKWPWKRFALVYVTSVAVINCLLHSHSLLTVPYCKRTSEIYSEKRTSKTLLKLIGQENSRHKSTASGKANEPISFKDE